MPTAYGAEFRQDVVDVMVGSALGLIMGFNEVVGGFIIPVIVGSLGDQFGLGTTMFMASGAVAIAMILSFLRKETAAPSKIKAAAAGEAEPAIVEKVL